jgi:hypothetical protein
LYDAFGGAQYTHLGIAVGKEIVEPIKEGLSKPELKAQRAQQAEAIFKDMLEGYKVCACACVCVGGGGGGPGWQLEKVMEGVNKCVHVCARERDGVCYCVCACVCMCVRKRELFVCASKKSGSVTVGSLRLHCSTNFGKGAF